MLPASLAAKWLPREFVESTRLGGAFTLLAYVVMLILFSLQLSDFLKQSAESSLLLDFNDGPILQINFDIRMYGIECRNLHVVVIDELREEPLGFVAKEYSLQTLGNGKDHRSIHARRAGSDGAEDEWARHQDRLHELESQDGQGELDSDWASSHDGFKHQSFEHVIEFHDFTLINFFAEWCVHCRQFAPKWSKIAAKVNEKRFVDANQNQLKVRALRMNCVDFRGICKQKRIDAFPTIRLYKSDGTFTRYNGERNEGSILKWIDLTVKSGAQLQQFKGNHQELESGCILKGWVRVPRVPGHLELMAGGGDQNLEPSMTNVSHAVGHLSFCSPSAEDQWNAGMCGLVQSRPWQSWSQLSKLGMRSQMMHASPLDGKVYATSAFHEAYEHYVRLVSTVTQLGTGYQFSHYGRTARLNETVVPQARFYFDFEPFALSLGFEDKRWYQFGTSLLAILGGVFVMMRLCAMMSIGVARTAERSSTPAGARTNGLLN